MTCQLTFRRLPSVNSNHSTSPKNSTTYGSLLANRLEPLQRDRQGQHSIRNNDKYRVCFVWTENGVEDVEIVDYH